MAKQSGERRLQEEQKAVRSLTITKVMISGQLGHVGSGCLQLHQHRRLTRAQSHHRSDEERKRRKILARKVGTVRLTREGAVT